jgi:hypothetical protein
MTIDFCSLLLGVENTGNKSHHRDAVGVCCCHAASPLAVAGFNNSSQSVNTQDASTGGKHRPFESTAL